MSHISIPIAKYPTELSPNLKIVQSGQTIQAVIDSCPVATGSLKAGFTNPYVVRVPPGHEKEYYSLVRTAADAASDKRNVKVIFEDNPNNNFVIHKYDDCEATTGWAGQSGTVLALDSTKKFEGENCFKMTQASGNITVQKTIASPYFDACKYQGMIFDIDIDINEIDQFQVFLFDSAGKYIRDHIGYSHHKGTCRVTCFLGFFGLVGDTTINFSIIKNIRVVFIRKSGVTGTITAYIDNIRFITTTHHTTAIIRFDDNLDEHWSIAAKNLELKGIKGSFATTLPRLMGTANYMSKEQVLLLNALGHNMINHGLAGYTYTNLNAQETYSEFMCMRQWLADQGINNTNNLHISPSHESNADIIKLLKQTGTIVMLHSINPFPAAYVSLSDPDFAIPELLSDYIALQRGGIIQIVFHAITNEANFNTRLDWIIENFSEIILATEVVKRMPTGFLPALSAKVLNAGYTKTLVEDYWIRSEHGDTIFFDPGGDNRNIKPLFDFTPYHKVEIINVADAAENLIFDPTFTAAGNHDVAAHDTIMTDSGESWTVGQLVGRTINNTPDGSSGVITANTATTITAVLSGGTSNDWQNGEAYTITPAGLNQAVGQDQRATFVYDGEGWDITNLYDKTP